MNLEDSREKINQELEGFFSECGTEKGQVEEIFSKIPDFVLRGGKRVRPALFLEGFRIGGGERIDECLRASLSIELCHNYFLMHDDIMDRDDLRRGGKTLHKSYEEDFNRWTAISHAINAGDYANTLSFQAVLDSDFPRERKYEVVKEIVEMQKKVYEGQALDLILHETPFAKVELSDVLDLHRLKTASYTVSSPLKAGYKLSPQSGGDIEKLGEYGRNIGIAFQIKDDLLDLFGEEDETGKSAASDIEEGKRTVPLILAYQKGSEPRKETITSIVGEGATREDLGIIREIVEETGAKRKCEEIAEEMVEEGKRAVGGIESDFLVDLADFVIERSY